MPPMREFVADVGNTRIKVGECAADGLDWTDVLPLDSPESWMAALDRHRASGAWTLAGTHPEARDQLGMWLREQSCQTRILDDYRQLPLRVQVDSPEKVGIDRLLNAVAVLPKVARGTPIVIVDAGSAVTVDIVDADSVFRGGAILPGYRLMAKALNDYTARLPFVEEFSASQMPLPGTNTVSAIKAGIGYAIHGGIDWIVQRLSRQFGTPKVFLAGGDAELLLDLDCQPELAGPFLTLEGIRLTVRNLLT
jgi:type III pantothenate kinase